MSFWRRINPRGAVVDFAHEWQRPNPYRWRVLGVSLAATFGILLVFIPDSQRIEPARPKVTWITSFAPDRTDEEITASNLANQQRKEEFAKLQEQREELRKDIYRELGRATFVDVDAMEEDIAREEAAEAARTGETPGTPQTQQSAPGAE